MDVYIKTPTRRTRRAKALNPQQDTGNETVELGLVRYFNSLAGWLRVGPNYKRHKLRSKQWTVAAARGTAATQLRKMTGVFVPRLELNSLVERSANKTWTSSCS